MEAFTQLKKYCPMKYYNLTENDKVVW